MRIYVDTNALIAALEGEDRISDLVRQLFETARSAGTQFVTSLLTLGELLVVPLRRRDDERVNAVMALFAGDEQLVIVPIDRHIVVDAADLRASYRSFKWPDAIHVATALAEDCPYFLSNDHDLPAMPGLTYARLQEPALLGLLNEASA